MIPTIFGIEHVLNVNYVIVTFHGGVATIYDVSGFQPDMDCGMVAAISGTMPVYIWGSICLYLGTMPPVLM